MNQVDAYERLAGVYDDVVVDPCYASWAAWLDRLWGADPEPVRDVLDVCCGTGLLAAELEPLGYRTVGTDASPAMLARARTRLGPDAVLLPAVLPDLPADPGFDGPFDAVVSTFDGLNYLPPGDFATALARIAARIRPGGWLVFDLHTDAMMRFTLANPMVAGAAEGVPFEIRSEVDPEARTCVTRIEMGESATAAPFSEVHRQWFHSDEQVRAALDAAGLRLLAVVDEYSDEPATADTLRATWVARRPA